MATTRMTFGAVLGTITDTASMVSKTVTTIGGGIDMANRFVESAATDQRDRQAIHRKTFRDTLLREARIDVARSNREVFDFCTESQANAALYAQAQEYLPDNIFGE
ncbi:hypothetical protein [Sphingobium chungangianum]